MASQVLSGNGSVSYTNNTGQNVRVVINFLGYNSPSYYGIDITWSNASIRSSYANAIGRNLAISGGGAQTGLSVYANNMSPVDSSVAGIGAEFYNGALPTELMLAPGQTFTATGTATGGSGTLQYNIVIIPENG